MDQQESLDSLQAGTGFMVSLVDGIEHFKKKGYTENLSPKFDHLESQQGAVQLYPAELKVDYLARYENSSDPNDNSILYAISSTKDQKIKGLYIESYGTYHESLSPAMIERLKDHPQ
jgi:hypothetical protein